MATSDRRIRFQGLPAGADLYLPEVGTVQDLSRHLHLSPSTIRRLIKEGQLTGRKLGGRWYVTRRALLGCLEAPDNPLRVLAGRRGGREGAS